MSASNATSLSRTELRAWRGMLATHATLISRLDAELERDHDLPLSSYEVLINLADAEDEKLRMSELADRLLLSRSGITRLADRLERQGLIERERCTDDGRGLFARLTPAGAVKLAAARPAHLAGVRRHFLAHVSEQEQQRLGALWERLAGQEGEQALDASAG